MFYEDQSKITPSESLQLVLEIVTWYNLNYKPYKNHEDDNKISKKDNTQEIPVRDLQERMFSVFHLSYTKGYHLVDPLIFEETDFYYSNGKIFSESIDIAETDLLCSTILQTYSPDFKFGKIPLPEENIGNHIYGLFNHIFEKSGSLASPKLKEKLKENLLTNIAKAYLENKLCNEE